MEDLKNWLESGHDYAEGLALLAKYGKNRTLFATLSRRKLADKLHYELKRIAKAAEIKVVTIKPAPPAPIKPVKAETKTRIIRGGRTILFELLPARLQKVYTEIVESYKVQRALHERAKLIRKDEDRKPVTGQMVELEQKIRKNWAAIDSWDGQPDVPGGAIDHRRINANRKFISSNRRKLEKMPDGEQKTKLAHEIQERIDELLNAGEEFGRSKDSLKGLGFKL